MNVGGPPDLVAAIKANGGTPGPTTKWLGDWNIRDGIGDWDAFFSSCKATSTTPLVLWWAFGDSLSPDAIQNGVWDPEQNVWVTQDTLLPILQGVMQKAQTASIAPLVAICNEFNRNGCESSPIFAAWYDACVATIRQACPAAKIIFPPGNWGDLAALSTTYAHQITESDLVGLQAVLFAPRQGVNAITNAGANLAAGFKALSTTKPTIVYDMALSTYGGNYSTTPPFPGGDPDDLDQAQAAGITSLTQAGPQIVVYRALTDDPTIDTANYGGYAEQHVGLTRSDGTKKPGYAALMALTTDPLATCQAQVQQLQAQLASETSAYQAAAATITALQAKIAAAKTALG